MVRLLAPSIITLILFATWAFAVFDVIGTDELLMRNLPKMGWLFVVIFVPSIGAFAWFALGRPVGAGLRPGVSRPDPNRSWQREPRRRRPRGIEDRDDWPPPS